MPTDEISWHAVASEIKTRCLSLHCGNNSSKERFISDIINSFLQDSSYEEHLRKREFGIASSNSMYINI